ncbi:MAG: hypothetical protein IT306_02065 [Chloroflexi bacterium]|nr:hypothetical protein [Chloroflexota bacterium]
MCIPINLDVPVVTHDHYEIGIARDILCACPGDHASAGSSMMAAFDAVGGNGDLWLRVSRAALPDLYIPFGEIVETQPTGVLLHVDAADVRASGWERLPAAVPVSA